MVKSDKKRIQKGGFRAGLNGIPRYTNPFKHGVKYKLWNDSYSYAVELLESGLTKEMCLSKEPG